MTMKKSSTYSEMITNIIYIYISVKYIQTKETFEGSKKWLSNSFLLHFTIILCSFLHKVKCIDIGFYPCDHISKVLWIRHKISIENSNGICISR